MFDPHLHEIVSAYLLKGHQLSHRRHPPETGSVHEDVRRIREELRPSHGPSQHLDAAILTVQECRPEHTSRCLCLSIVVQSRIWERQDEMWLALPSLNWRSDLLFLPFWTIRNRMCVGTWRCSTTCWSLSRGFLAMRCCSKTTWRSCPKMLPTEKTLRVRHLAHWFYRNMHAHGSVSMKPSQEVSQTINLWFLLVLKVCFCLVLTWKRQSSH